MNILNQDSDITNTIDLKKKENPNYDNEKSLNKTNSYRLMKTIIKE